LEKELESQNELLIHLEATTAKNEDVQKLERKLTEEIQNQGKLTAAGFAAVQKELHEQKEKFGPFAEVVHENFEAIKNYLKETESKELQKMEYKKKMAILQGANQAGASLAQIGSHFDCPGLNKLGRGISISTDIAGNLSKISSALDFTNNGFFKAMSSAVPFLGVVSGVLSFLDIFDDGPSETEVILDAIQNMHEDMMKGFQEVNQNIGKLAEHMDKRFDLLAEHLDHRFDAVHDHLNQLGEVLLRAQQEALEHLDTKLTTIHQISLMNFQITQEMIRYEADKTRHTMLEQAFTIQNLVVSHMKKREEFELGLKQAMERRKVEQAINHTELLAAITYGTMQEFRNVLFNTVDVEDYVDHHFNVLYRWVNRDALAPELNPGTTTTDSLSQSGTIVHQSLPDTLNFFRRYLEQLLSDSNHDKAKNLARELNSLSQTKMFPHSSIWLEGTKGLIYLAAHEECVFTSTKKKIYQQQLGEALYNGLATLSFLEFLLKSDLDLVLQNYVSQVKGHSGHLALINAIERALGQHPTKPDGSKNRLDQDRALTPNAVRELGDQIESRCNQIVNAALMVSIDMS
ncbi:MAG: hypothetical protein KDK65_07055, partial [Chlamydiia bacterium]|nr:hypothetical protein [Chlamydiia bacterium]